MLLIDSSIIYLKGFLCVLGIFPGQGGQQVYIVATDLNNIPPGSVILDPRTGIYLISIIKRWVIDVIISFLCP